MIELELIGVPPSMSAAASNSGGCTSTSTCSIPTMPAQGLPDVADEPGGLHLDQLGELVDAAITVDGCSGLSIAIYDPDQDPDRAAARRIVALVSDALDALDQSRSG